ncbi:MAG: hypothetical protein NT094_02550, partial [Candidatus Staskawiczbacteria bacterium]|nr:hypothetical protein [Candidatus Staskawiczbacteria bacterium]
MKFFSLRKIIFVTIFFSLATAGIAKADNYGDVATFNVDKNFDATARTQITAKLIKTTNNLYFYIEKSWWDLQPQAKQTEILV